MAAIGTGAIPGRRLRVPGIVALAARQTAEHAKAVAARLSGSALTIAGLGCVDVGAFHAHTIAGWVVTGLTVLLLDWKLE
jgi:hypothetical protein